MTKKDGIPFVGSNLAVLLDFLARKPGRLYTFRFVPSAFRSHKPTWFSLLEVEIPGAGLSFNGKPAKGACYALREIVRSGITKGVVEEDPPDPAVSVVVERDDVKRDERTRLRITPLGEKALHKFRARDAAHRLRGEANTAPGSQRSHLPLSAHAVTMPVKVVKYVRGKGGGGGSAP